MTTFNITTPEDEDEELTQQEQRFEDRLEAIFGQISEDDEVRVTLHKANKFGRFPICDNLDPERIDYHEIGTKHGAGTYKVYVKWRKQSKGFKKEAWDTRNWTFEVDEYYNEVKEKNREEEQRKKSFNAPNQNGDMIAMMIQQQNLMMQNVMTMMGGMFTAIASRPAPASNDNDLLKYVLSERREERKESSEIFMKGIEMGMNQKAAAEEPETNWKDIALEVIAQAPAILSPIFGGMAKKALDENQHYLQNPEFMDFVKTGIKEQHPVQADKIFEAAGLNEEG